MTYDTGDTITIADLTYLDIREAAMREGLTEITVLGANGKTGDQCVVVFALGGVRVAGTNGPSIWEEQDLDAFTDLLTREGIVVDERD